MSHASTKAIAAQIAEAGDVGSGVMCGQRAGRRHITRIRLAALEISLDVLRRHQLHGVPEVGNRTRPIMRTAAGLRADEMAPA